MLTLLESLPEKELFPGFHFKFVHAENMTFSLVRIDAGSPLPEHSHPHEQVSMVQKGKLELTLDGEVHVLEPGSILQIPGNAPHSAVAITDCLVLDVFHPIREDFK